MIELSQGSIHLISFQQAVGGSLAKVQRVTEEIDEDVEPILLPRNPVEVVVLALEDITVPGSSRVQTFNSFLRARPVEILQPSDSGQSAIIPESSGTEEEI